MGKHHIQCPFIMGSWRMSLFFNLFFFYIYILFMLVTTMPLCIYSNDIYTNTNPKSFVVCSHTTIMLLPLFSFLFLKISSFPHCSNLVQRVYLQIFFKILYFIFKDFYVFKYFLKIIFIFNHFSYLYNYF